MKRSLIIDTHDSSCYFRTSTAGDERKALLQITERCNLHCAHCFVSSGNYGTHMSIGDIVERVLPRLREARVTRLTLTGGEPFAHPEILEICAETARLGIPVGICTNGTLVTDEQIVRLARLGNVHVNVSFDGFRPESHGRFRGAPGSFHETVETTRKLSRARLLQGLLSTPNALTNVDDFTALCEFAVEVGAEYLLMNPLSSFGRGVQSRGRLRATDDVMRAIRAATDHFRAQGLDLVLIRFPNDDKPLASCVAGQIIYVFADGATAVCPYLVFAARTPGSRYRDAEFLVGNIIAGNISSALDAYDFHKRFAVGTNETCGSCRESGSCGKGCPASVVSRGGLIGEIDADQCPVVEPRRLVQLRTLPR